jgi:hypothetical protein
MGDFPGISARLDLQQRAAVDLEKLQDHFQGVFDFVVDLFGRQIDETCRQIGNHLFEAETIFQDVWRI